MTAPRVHAIAPFMVVAVLLSACGGALGYRSVAEGKGAFPIGPGVDRVRIEIENGSLGVDRSETREVTYSGGVRRAGDTPEMLARLEAVAVGFAATTDPKHSGTLVLRGPHLPAGCAGVLGFEVGVHLPADLPLDIVITGSGRVVLANRAAATHIETGRGDLRFVDCAGGLDARTGSGNVIAIGHRGRLDVQTMRGDMQAFVREPGDLIRLVSGKGTLQLYVPPSIEFDLDARTELGRINNGFGLSAERVGDYSAALVAKTGRATTKVVLRTASGHASLAPKVWPPPP